jgi:hypothetical protein
LVFQSFLQTHITKLNQAPKNPIQITPAHQHDEEDALGRLFLWLGFGEIDTLMMLQRL